MGKWGPLLLVLGLAAYLRLANVGHNPGWYSDEGTHLDIARFMASGRIQYLAINQSTLLFAKLPLFEGLLALVGPTMDHLRWLTGTLGVLSVGLLYGATRIVTGDEWLALLVGLLLAIYRPAVLYSRFGFSYNLLTPLALLVWLALAKQSRPGHLALASAWVGLGLVSDLMMAAFIPLLLVAGWRREWRLIHFLLALLPALIPFALYSLLSMAVSPEAFWFDLAFTVSRLGGVAPAGQFHNLVGNLTILFSQDSWLVLGLVGLFWLRPGRVGWLVGLFWLVPVLVLGRTNALYNLSFYYLIPLLPFPLIGLAAMGRKGWLTLNRFPHLRLGLALLVAIPFLRSTMGLMREVQTTFVTDIEPFLLRPEHVSQVTDYVNAHTSSNDLVIASPTVAWLLDSRVADFQMMVAVSGRATPHLPANIPTNRFAFDPSLAQASYVIIDPLWFNWAIIHVPGLAEKIAEIQTWSLVFTAGELAVYQPNNGNIARISRFIPIERLTKSRWNGGCYQNLQMN